MKKPRALGKRNAASTMQGEEEVQAIRDLVALGFSQRAVSRSTKHSQSSVSEIVNGKTWSHLPNEPRSALRRVDLDDVIAMMRREGGLLLLCDGRKVEIPPGVPDDVDLLVDPLAGLGATDDAVLVTPAAVHAPDRSER